MTSLNLYILVTLLTVVCSQLSSGPESCDGNQTSYSSRNYVQKNESYEQTIYKSEAIKDNCNILREFLSWLTNSEKCKTKYRKVSSTSTLYHQVTREQSTNECCPGYIKSGGNCSIGCEKGKYGEKCEKNCSCSNVDLYCDKETGKCLCPAGFTGENCTDECMESFFGSNCTKKCMCENNSTCNSTNGACSCTEPGWEGHLCNKECSNGTYGLYCEGNCTCNENETCDHVTGNCTCKSGWKGNNCSQECDSFTYGIACLENCTCNRRHAESCDKVTGDCRCHHGYFGDCHEECPYGLYGPDCNFNCADKCTGTTYCDPVNGTCICVSKKGANCSEECDDGFYGLNCETDCECNTSNSNGSCGRDGQCVCLAGWTGRTCEQECPQGLYGQNCSGKGTSPVTVKGEPEGVIEDIWYIIIAVISALVVAVAIVLAIYSHRVKSRRRRKRNRESLKSSSQEFPALNTCGKETIPLENCNNEHKIHMDEDSVLEKENSTRKTNNNVQNVSEAAGEKDYSHVTENNTSATNVITECIEDDYSIPDKDSDMNKHTGGGEHLKEGLPAAHTEELYDTTDENTCPKENDQHTYNTFQDVIKIQQEAKRKESESEEDYDTITHNASDKKKPEGIEHYSSFEQVRKLSLQDSLEDDDEMYNVLHEHHSKHAYDSRYHHISIKDKTIEGESFAVVIPPMGLSTQRQFSTGKKLPKQSSLKDSTVIIEELEEPKTENKQFAVNKSTSDGLQDEDETEVIYDECDAEDDNENSRCEGIDTRAQEIGASMTERVYEECDADEHSRSPSIVVYEDVDDEEESENESVNEDDEEKPEPDQGKLRPHLKKTNERRREDYEDFAL